MTKDTTREAYDAMVAVLERIELIVKFDVGKWDDRTLYAEILENASTALAKVRGES